MFFVMSIIAALGFGFGFGLLVLHPRKGSKRLPSPIKEYESSHPSSVKALIEETRWLPVVDIRHEVCNSLGYPVRKGIRVVVVELEGNIHLIGEDQASTGAFLEHAGFRIGLTVEDRQQLGDVLKDRIADQAMIASSVKLLRV